METTKEKKLQWHPAFYAGLQIELEQDAWNLEFENEHQLGTKPMAIDVLIIKKRTEVPVQKNIGRIFRQYNIVEYKSPTDYLSIDDFYKVYGYTCFYKSQAQKTDQRKVTELTITFVVSHYPRELLRHLKEDRNLQLMKKEPGIYYITGDVISMQLLLTGELSRDENLWLKSLTDQIQDAREAEYLLEEYKKHEDKNFYQSVIKIIVEANREKFEEASEMSDILMELMQHRIDAEVEKQVEKKVEKEKEKESARVNELNRRLAAESNIEDIIKAANDRKYQLHLLEKYGI